MRTPRKNLLGAASVAVIRTSSALRASSLCERRRQTSRIGAMRAALISASPSKRVGRSPPHPPWTGAARAIGDR
jgi:hypothetical protein